MLRKRLTLAAALAALVAAPAAAQAQSLDSARAFLAGLYDGYRRGQPDYVADRAARRLYAPKLLGLIRADAAAAQGEVGILDGDPICDCQDAGGLKLQSLTVSAAGTTKAQAKVAISLDGEARKLTFDLQVMDGAWRIADIHSADTPSLVGMLEEGLKQEAKPRRH